MKRLGLLSLAIAGFGAFALASGGALAANGPGISKKEILICSYQPMTGKVSSYFRMGKGADAWFKHVNETGGINGRMVNYKMVDDKYEPARTKNIVKRFIERDKCFAIVAPLGSAPTSAVIDYITSKNVPLIGAGQDDRVPPASVKALFDALPTAPDRKELWIEPEATHGKVWVAAPDEYRRRLAHFCELVVGRGRVPPAR